MTTKFAKQIDSNHKTIRDRLREIPGFEVEDTSRIGKGFPDLMVGGPYYGTNESIFVLAELKSAKGKLRPSQEKFRDRWSFCVRVIQAKTVSEVLVRGFGWPESQAEVLNL